MDNITFYFNIQDVLTFAKKMFAYLINIAGTHSYQQIVVGTCLQQVIFDGVKGREEVTLRAFFADIVCQIFHMDAEGVCLTGCVHIGQYNNVCQGKRIGKLIPEGFRTCVSMRLEDADDPVMRIIAGSSQSSRNLCRMMGVIINDGDAAEFSLVFESSGCSTKGL